MGVPKLRELFFSVFGEPTASNNAAWLRRKLAERPDGVFGQGRCERVRARDAGAAIWTGGGGNDGNDGNGGGSSNGGNSGESGSSGAAGAAECPAPRASRVILQWEGLQPSELGDNVEVYWPDDKTWWAATVLECDVAGRRLQLLYSNLQEEDISGDEFECLVRNGHLAACLTERRCDADTAQRPYKRPRTSDSQSSGLVLLPSLQQQQQQQQQQRNSGPLPLPLRMQQQPQQPVAPSAPSGGGGVSPPPPQGRNEEQKGWGAAGRPVLASSGSCSSSCLSDQTGLLLSLGPSEWEQLLQLGLGGLAGGSRAAAGGDGPAPGAPAPASFGAAAGAAPAGAQEQLAQWLAPNVPPAAAAAAAAAAVAAAAAGLMPASFLWGEAAAAASACTAAGGYPELTQLGAAAATAAAAANRGGAGGGRRPPPLTTAFGGLGGATVAAAAAAAAARLAPPGAAAAAWQLLAGSAPAPAPAPANFSVGLAEAYDSSAAWLSDDLLQGAPSPSQCAAEGGAAAPGGAPPSGAPSDGGALPSSAGGAIVGDGDDDEDDDDGDGISGAMPPVTLDAGMRSLVDDVISNGAAAPSLGGTAWSFGAGAGGSGAGAGAGAGSGAGAAGRCGGAGDEDGGLSSYLQCF